MNLPYHVKVPMSFCRLKAKSKLFGLVRPQFATIAKCQWFSKAPSPLNGMVVHHRSNDGMVTYHC